jgi:serine/threonine protein kinase
MGCVLCGKCGAVEDDNKTVTPPPSVLDSIMQLPRGSSASLSLDSFKVKGILGIGGFGLVREVHYRGGKYALKSMCKHDLLQRGHGTYVTTMPYLTLSSNAQRSQLNSHVVGVHSVFLEVQTLQFVKTLRPALRRFLCNLHLAFQDDRYVYICVDLCSRGDLRANLSRTAGHRFSEPVARFYIAQVFIALHGIITDAQILYVQL